MKNKHYHSQPTGSVSLCMIVKNEEAMLQDCLASVKDIVNQMVIVDTGSTDKTIEIAKSFGADIYHFEWCDDFSAARNESIKYAAMDWILWMDADERLDPNSVSELKRCIQAKEKPLYYKVMIRSTMDDDRLIHDSDAHRLFSNHYGIRFQNRIHEQISYSAHEIGAKEKTSTILLHHIGYDNRHVDLDKKVLRNRKLLIQMAEEIPDSVYVHYTLAQNYGQTNDWMTAVKHLEKALRIKSIAKPMTASIFNVLSEAYLHLDKWNLVKTYAEKSLALIPMQSGAIYIMYRLADRNNDYTGAITWLNKLLKNTKYLLYNPKSISSDTLLPISHIFGTMGGVYLKLNDKKNALNSFQKAWEESDDIELLTKIIGCARDLSEWSIVADTLLIYMEKGNRNAESLDLYGFALIQLNRFADALGVFLELHELVPHEIGVVRRIASLYAKLDDMENAQTWVMLLNQMED